MTSTIDGQTLQADRLSRFPHMVRRVGLVVLFFAVYLALERLSYIETLRPFAMMAWNPALGVLVAVVCRWGKKALPLVFLAPFAGALFIRGFPLTPLYTAFVAMLVVVKTFAIWQAGERIAALRSHLLYQNAQAGRLLAMIPVTLIIAIVHAGSLAVLGLLAPSQILATGNRLWMGDLIGISVQMPLCMLILEFAHNPSRLEINRVKETLLQTAISLFALWFVFVAHKEDADAYFYILFLPMIWVVLAHGMAGAIIANQMVQAATIFHLLAFPHPPEDVTLFQALALVFVTSSLALAFSIEQSKKATERLQDRERALAASLKESATSELAGVLAHELSHPIGAISNYAAVVDDLIKDADDNTRAIFGKLRQEAKRAKDTVHRLREFFRSGSLTIEPVNLGELVNDSIALLRSRSGHEGISIRIASEADDIVVLADRIQLHGVLHNILINALDAIKAMPPARRTIEVQIWRSAAIARITIEDAGLGIAADVKDHIFQPFVTTKKDGLGLGLSTSRSIIHGHGGTIELTTSVLGGAKFEIVLPLEKS